MTSDLKIDFYANIFMVLFFANGNIFTLIVTSHNPHTQTSQRQKNPQPI